MSSSDWEEVKRLAADFQRAQLTSASQRYFFNKHYFMFDNQNQSYSTFF